VSHSSGIEVSDQLRNAFVETARAGGSRFLKAQIEEEKDIELKQEVQAQEDWENDFNLVPPVLEPKQASYILFRTDKQNDQGNFVWHLLCYVPDKAPVRQKMVYASTRANLKIGLGTHYFLEDIFGTNPSDFDYKGYKAFEKHQSASAPLTEGEKLKEEELEGGLFTGGAGTSSAYAHGVAFPADDDVYAAFDSMKDGSINYIQLGIDTDAERIILKHTDTTELTGVGEHVPLDEPRFHFYKWSHVHEDADYDSLIYVYTTPDGSKGTKSAPVKLRMLYSTSKANVAQIAESKGFTIDCRLECASGGEINENEINPQLHPPKPAEKKTFAKPKPKATRKLIK